MAGTTILFLTHFIVKPNLVAAHAKLDVSLQLEDRLQMMQRKRSHLHTAVPESAGAVVLIGLESTEVKQLTISTGVNTTV